VSSFSRWSYTATATFWRPTLDEFGQPSSYVRTVRSCSFMAGGKQGVADTGEEFIPRTTLYLESSEASAPKAGDLVTIGTSTAASPISGYETVRLVKRFDPSTFNEGLPDYEVATT
jgi:hypothetical protein